MTPANQEFPTPRKKKLRTRKWIRPDLQFKIIFVTMVVSGVVLLINYQISLFTLWRIEGVSSAADSLLVKKVFSLLWKSAAIAAAITIPLSIIVGTVYSFRFCGPIYALQRYFERRVEGRWDEPFRLRKRDDLQDVKDTVNGSNDLILERLRSQNRLLTEYEEIVKSLPDAGRYQEVLERTRVEQAEVARRLGEAEETGARTDDSKAEDQNQEERAAVTEAVETQA